MNVFGIKQNVKLKIQQPRPGDMEAHLVAVKAHLTLELWRFTSRGLEARPEALDADSGAMEAHLGAVEAHPGSLLNLGPQRLPSEY